MPENDLKDLIRVLEEELILKEETITELLDFTRESVLEKYLKVYTQRKKGKWLDTEVAVIKEFLKEVLK